MTYHSHIVNPLGLDEHSPPHTINHHTKPARRKHEQAPWSAPIGRSAILIGADPRSALIEVDRDPGETREHRLSSAAMFARGEAELSIRRGLTSTVTAHAPGPDRPTRQ